MAENKKNITKTVKKTVHKNKSAYIGSNDDLLESIMKKKKDKKNNSINNTKKNSLKKERITDINAGLSNEEILEQILNKKKKKKKVEVNDQDLPKLKTKKRSNSLTSDSNDELLESILNKKKSKKVKTSVKVNKKSDVINDELTELPRIELPKPPKNVFKKDSISHNKNDVEFETNNVFLENSIDLSSNSKANVTKNKNDTINKDVVNKNRAVDKTKLKTKKVNVSVKKNNKIKIDRKSLQSIIGIFLIILIVIFGILLIQYKNSSYTSEIQRNEKDSETIKLEEEKLRKKQDYENCLIQNYSDIDNTESITTYINEINAYLSSMSVSVQYEDLTYGFTYQYNASQSYYAASTIKALDALYIYSKAASGEINLDDTLVYSKKYKVSSSSYTSTLKVGSNVSIRNLVKAAVMVSDNGAHQMLIDYIGRDTLKSYGLSLGATSTLSGTDNFGYINTHDGLIYMKNLNTFFENNGELGEELKSYFINSDENGLKFDDIEAATKYGEYSPNFHNIGIVYASHPYVISILTSEKSGDFVKKVSDINQMIYKLNELYYSNRSTVCYDTIYNQ